MAQNYRDTLFRMYFNDKTRLLSLLNALLGTNSTNPDEININTLDGLFFEKYKNDISCTFKGKTLVLIEHQSTINYNMPLRCLIYLTELYKQQVELNKQSKYKVKSIKLPRPIFYVFYNGLAAAKEMEVMKLSDSFDEAGDINAEIIVKQYNINAGNNDELLKECTYLQNYCIFVNRVKLNQQQHKTINESIIEAFEYCMNNNIMTDFLSIHEKELSSMYDWYGGEYDEELAKQVRLQEEREEAIEQGMKQGLQQGIEKGMAQGIEVGLKQGMEQAKIQSVRNMINKLNLTVEQAMNILEIPDDEQDKYMKLI